MKNLITLTIIGLVETACNQQINDKQVFKTQSVLSEYKDSVTDFGIVTLIANGKYLDTASIVFEHR